MRGFGGGMGGLMAQAQKMQAKIAKVHVNEESPLNGLFFLFFFPLVIVCVVNM